MRFITASLIGLILLSWNSVQARTIAFGAAGGIEFPFAHSKKMDPGPRAEAYYRLDPYEVRFHYAHLEVDFYTVSLAMKHFFSNDEIRPFVEASLGPTIVDTPGEGLAYGISPEFSGGVELGINQNFSTHVNTRYTAYWYFGDTGSGSMEAQHALSLVAGVTLWF